MWWNDHICFFLSNLCITKWNTELFDKQFWRLTTITLASEVGSTTDQTQLIVPTSVGYDIVAKQPVRRTIKNPRRNDVGKVAPEPKSEKDVKPLENMRWWMSGSAARTSSKCPDEELDSSFDVAAIINEWENNYNDNYEKKKRWNNNGVSRQLIDGSRRD